MIKTSTLAAMLRTVPVIVMAMLAVGGERPAHAATPPVPLTDNMTGPFEFAPYVGSRYIRDLIERAQRALATLGLYDGPVSGIADPALSAAIRQFLSRAGMIDTPIPDTAIVDEDLVRRLESSVNIRSLLGRLAQVRAEATARARTQLLANPATRHLIESRNKPASANAMRDTAGCFARPDPACLLVEARESAVAVATVGQRDWALGEILVAQVLAGLSADAMQTAGRINDPRLIIVALRRIAEAEAHTGRPQQALDTLALIPEGDEQAAARVDVARLLSETGASGAALDAADPVLDGKGPANDAYLASLVPVLAREGRKAEAERTLVELVMRARAMEHGVTHSAAFREIAIAYIAIGEADVALAMIDEVSDKSDRNAVLVAAASSLADDQRATDAIDLARRVTGARYQALALADVARRIMPQSADTAGTLLDEAQQVADSIALPYAKDYALSRIALIRAGLGPSSLGAARKIATAIVDPALRAETLWRFALDRNAPVSDEAEAATAAIKGPFARAWLFAELADRALDALAVQTAPQPDAMVQAKAMASRALSAAQKVTTPWARARILARLAVTLDRLDGGVSR